MLSWVAITFQVVGTRESGLEVAYYGEHEGARTCTCSHELRCWHLAAVRAFLTQAPQGVPASRVAEDVVLLRSGAPLARVTSVGAVVFDEAGVPALVHAVVGRGCAKYRCSTPSHSSATLGQGHGGDVQCPHMAAVVSSQACKAALAAVVATAGRPSAPADPAVAVDDDGCFAYQSLSALRNEPPVPNATEGLAAGPTDEEKMAEESFDRTRGCLLLVAVALAGRVALTNRVEQSHATQGTC